MRNNSFLFVIVVFCIFSTACFAETVDRIVAVVNDQTITALEVQDAMKPLTEQITRASSGKNLEEKLSQARKDVMERLIEEKLILQEAKNLKIDVKNEEVVGMLAEVRSKFPNEATFQEAIRSQGLNLWQLKKIYKEQIMVKKMVRQYVRVKANITPKQILDYYQAHREEYKAPQGVEISQILIKYKTRDEMARAKKTAAQVLQLLEMGADFASVAKKYSEGPNAQEGGVMGLIERGVMAKEIDDAIFSMKEGEISKSISTSAGFVIVRVNSIRKSQYMPLEEAKPQIEERLLDETAKSALNSWVADLKAKAFIQVNE